MNKVKTENELSEPNELATITQFTPGNQQQNQQQGFIMRSGNQNYRFAGPQNFIHQQPPPMSQNSQFNGPRGQIMSNSSMNLYQNVCQSQMMQQPPPPTITTTTATHQYIQQQQDINAFQQANNFHPNAQQGNMNRFSVPQQHQPGDGSGGMMTANYQQQPRFRSQW